MTVVKDLKHILCPTDFSSCAKGALDEAAALAALTDAEVCLLHVFHDPPYATSLGSYAGSLSAILGELREQGTQALRDLAEPYRQKGVRIETLMMHGVPHKAILDRAEEWGADCIVMGTHGRTGFERALAGSVSERVVRLASCPVLVTRQEA